MNTASFSWHVAHTETSCVSCALTMNDEDLNEGLAVVEDALASLE